MRLNLKTTMKWYGYNVRKFGLLYAAVHYFSRYERMKPFCDYKCMEILKKYYSTISSERMKCEIEELYFVRTGKKMNIDKPVGFNEKIQWLKFYDVTEAKIRLCDKYKARKFVRQVVGEKHLVPLLGVYQNIDEVDFGILPRSFVMKSTQGCAYNVIVKDRRNINISEIRRKFRWWLRTEYAYAGLEFQYKARNAKVLIEKYMGGQMDEYKFICFNGRPEFFWVRSLQDGELSRNFFDMDGREIEFHFGNAPKKRDLELTESFQELKEAVTKLCSGFRFVRVDTFVIDGNWYIGELTFNTGCGYDDWGPESEGIRYGERIKSQI